VPHAPALAARVVDSHKVPDLFALYKTQRRANPPGARAERRARAAGLLADGPPLLVLTLAGGIGRFARARALFLNLT
jgi:hypothetical protein